MTALLGGDLRTAEEVSRLRRDQGGRLEVANVNAPGQVVVAGGREDLAWLADNAGELGIRRVMPLTVAGAFHSRFMAPAQAEVAAALEASSMKSPRFPVWSNTTARPHQPGKIGELLTRQLVEPVLFAESLEDMSAAGIGTFIHVGPGDMTAGLARKTVPGAEVHAISGLDDMPSVLDAVGTMGAH
jgi:[acyl-carrier-protein] S-malonyltransferase